MDMSNRSMLHEDREISENEENFPVRKGNLCEKEKGFIVFRYFMSGDFFWAYVSFKYAYEDRKGFKI